MVHPHRFPELEARPWFAAARISVVVTGSSRAESSDAVTCGFHIDHDASTGSRSPMLHRRHVQL